MSKVRIGVSLAGVAALAALTAGCGSSSSSGGSMLTKVGDGEKQLNLVVWAGYAENGSTDKTVDWVSGFTKETGCVVQSKTAATSDEMFSLMQTGQYDGVSASGDSSVRMIDAGLVAPVNVDLVSNYADISSFLKDQPYNSSGGKHYGIPHGWGANYLMYNSKVVTTAPDSWGAVFDTNRARPWGLTETPLAYDPPVSNPAELAPVQQEKADEIGRAHV